MTDKKSLSDGDNVTKGSNGCIYGIDHLIFLYAASSSKNA